MVAPIDPLEGQRYFELLHSEGKGNDLERIYNITYAGDDYINPTIDGKMIFEVLSHVHPIQVTH